MGLRNKFLLLLPLLLCVSCLHSRSAGPAFTANTTVVVNYGDAILKINGRINENVYSFWTYEPMSRDEGYYDNPLISEGTISKNETKYLSAGDEYTFIVVPTEVVTINITSLNDDDVGVSVFEYGNEKKYTLKGTNRMGLFLSFQNR